MSACLILIFSDVTCGAVRFLFFGQSHFHPIFGDSTTAYGDAYGYHMFIYGLYIISTSVLYIQASVFPGTCPYKVGSELCSSYVRFDVLIWGIIPHDDVICKI